MKNVLIMGCGELGSRHLQGLLLSHNSLNIVVYDKFKNSLSLAMKRANEVNNRVENKVISYTTASQCLNSDWDLVIIATTESEIRGFKKFA